MASLNEILVPISDTIISELGLLAAAVTQVHHEGSAQQVREIMTKMQAARDALQVQVAKYNNVRKKPSESDIAGRQQRQLNRIINHLRDKIEKKDQLLVERNTDLSRLQDSITRMERQMKEQSSLTQGLKKELNKQQQEVISRDAKIKRLTGAIDILTAGTEGFRRPYQAETHDLATTSAANLATAQDSLQGEQRHPAVTEGRLSDQESLSEVSVENTIVGDRTSVELSPSKGDHDGNRRKRPWTLADDMEDIPIDREDSGGQRRRHRTEMPRRLWLPGREVSVEIGSSRASVNTLRWNLEDVRRYDFDCSLIPSSIVQDVRQQVKRWDRLRRDWSYGMTSGLPKCAERYSSHKTSVFRDNQTQACQFCLGKGYVCVKMADGKLEPLPVPLENRGTAGPNDVRYWKMAPS
ncbi:MAG: hypothetical protein Q9219_002507 [cf. Caloplaca sp. 3 TL-2023]